MKATKNNILTGNCFTEILPTSIFRTIYYENFQTYRKTERTICTENINTATTKTLKLTFPCICFTRSMN